MYGVIDLGSNTVRLSVYNYIDEKLERIFSKKETVGLASFVNQFNQLSETGIQAAIQIVKNFYQTTQILKIDIVYVIATASIRNVTNAKYVMEKLQQSVNVQIELLSGEEEALSDLEGVLQINEFDTGLVVDIGGGSTEIVILEENLIRNAKAIPMGSLNTYMEYVKHLFPTKSELKTIQEAVIEQIKLGKIKPSSAKTIYGIGGTNRAACKMVNDLFGLSPDNREINEKQIKKVINILLKQDKKSLLKMIRLAPERMHTLIPGLMILYTIVTYFKSSKIFISDYGLREGYLLKKLKGGFSKANLQKKIEKPKVSVKRKTSLVKKPIPKA